MAGVYVFGGGIQEEVHPVLVAADGTVSTETYPASRSRGIHDPRVARPRGGGGMGSEDRRRVPLLAGAAGVHVRPAELGHPHGS